VRRPSRFWQFPIATLCCNASARCALLHLAGVVPIAQFTEVNVVLNVRLTVATVAVWVHMVTWRCREANVAPTQQRNESPHCIVLQAGVPAATPDLSVR